VGGDAHPFRRRLPGGRARRHRRRPRDDARRGRPRARGRGERGAAAAGLRRRCPARVTFFAVIWNWTPFPRLLLFRPPAGLALAGDGRTPSDEAAAPVLAALSGCALAFDRFVYADESAALRLFVAQGASTLRVLGSEPDAAGVPDEFGSDDVVAALTFRAPELDGVRVLSASIEGPSPGFGAVLGVLLQVRTNVGLDGALRSLALP
jgi:hypothetical protein